MHTDQQALYRRIVDFDIDEGHSAFPFAARLASENQWSAAHAARAIAEYRRFLFLAVAAGHPVSPSDDVDQVWHLHLLYTRSYWTRLCGEVLQQPLHHGPTRGGSAESAKFTDWYSRTLESYRSLFDEQPPADLWPSAHERQVAKPRYARVSTSANWIVPKIRFPRRLVRPSPWIIPVAIGVASCGAASGLNPFDFTGPTFLLFYVALAIATSLVAFRLRRPAPTHASVFLRAHQQPDVYDIAFLAGSGAQAANAAIVHLVDRGHLTVSSTGEVSLGREPAPPSHPLENAVMSAVQGMRSLSARERSESRTIRRHPSVIAAVESIDHRLTGWNLLLSPPERLRRQWYPSLVMSGLLVVGLIKVAVGVSRDRPVAFLIILCALAAFGALLSFAVPVRRTRLGDTLLKELRATGGKTVMAKERSRAGSSDLAIGVALFGLTALNDSPRSDLKKALGAPSSDGGGAGGCGGGGGGGCGGGCGGCGGS